MSGLCLPITKNFDRLYILAVCASILQSSAAHAALRGVVVAPDGKPLAHAAVQLFQAESIDQRLERWDSASQRTVVANAVTDAAGAFSADADFPGTAEANV